MQEQYDALEEQRVKTLAELKKVEASQELKRKVLEQIAKAPAPGNDNEYPANHPKTDAKVSPRDQQRLPKDQLPQTSPSQLQLANEVPGPPPPKQTTATTTATTTAQEDDGKVFSPMDDAWWIGRNNKWEAPGESSEEETGGQDSGTKPNLPTIS